METSTLNIFSLILCVCLGAKLPIEFKKCDVTKPHFQKCLSEAVHGAIVELYRPLHDYDLPSLAIVNDPEAKQVFGNSEDGLLQTFTNYSFYGLTRPLSTQARMNFGNNILQINSTFPKVELDLDYEAHGTVVLLPVDTSTRLHSLFIKPTFRFTFKLEEYGKSVRFYRVLDTELVIVAEDLVFDFVNLFNNEELNNGFNAELGNHAKAVLEKFTPQQQSFTPFFQTAFCNFLEKVPKNELFDGF